MLKIGKLSKNKIMITSSYIKPERYSFVKSVQYLSLLGSCSALRFWPYIKAFLHISKETHSIFSLTKMNTKTQTYT